MTDTEMIDWLEAQINEQGEIHLHDGQHPRGQGLGLRPGSRVRTLRQAITQAAGRGAAQQAPAQQVKPVFWTRVHPDGTPTDDVLPDHRIEAVRKDSGAWAPLYGHPPHRTQQ